MKIYFATSKENEFIRAEVYYRKGGYNCFTCKEEPRGIVVSFRPVKREVHDLDGRQYTSEEYMAFSGMSWCVKELKRASEKQLNSVCEKILPIMEELVALFQDEKYVKISYKLYNTFA